MSRKQDWTDKAAIDYGVTMIRLRATKLYMSDANSFNDIREAINCALDRLDGLLKVLTAAREGERECPCGWCDDGNNGCDWCTNGGDNGECEEESSDR